MKVIKIFWKNTLVLRINMRNEAKMREAYCHTLIVWFIPVHRSLSLKLTSACEQTLNLSRILLKIDTRSTTRPFNCCTPCELTWPKINLEWSIPKTVSFHIILFQTGKEYRHYLKPVYYCPSLKLSHVLISNLLSIAYPFCHTPC